MPDHEPVSGNKQMIHSIALSLFSKKGYEAVGVQEIAQAADVTKPTLYHYFGSKRGLLDAIVNECGDGFVRMIEKAADYAHDVKNGLDAIATAMVEFARTNPEFYRLHLALYFSPVESESNMAVRALNLRIYGLVETFFRRASADHGNMKGRHDAYAATFIGLVNTYIGMWLNGLARLDDQRIGKAVHQFMHGIFS